MYPKHSKMRTCLKNPTFRAAQVLTPWFLTMLCSAQRPVGSVSIYSFFFFPPIVQPTMWISFSLFCILLKFSCESRIVLLLPWALVSAPYCWKGFKHHFPCDLWNEARSWYRYKSWNYTESESIRWFGIPSSKHFVTGGFRQPRHCCFFYIYF